MHEIGNMVFHLRWGSFCATSTHLFSASKNTRENICALFPMHQNVLTQPRRDFRGGSVVHAF